MLDGREAIVAVVRAIDKKRIITPSDELVSIHYANDLHKPAPYEDVVRLLKKLQNDEKILKVIKTPDESEDHCWKIKLYKKFDEYNEQLKQTKEYEDYTGEKYEKKVILDLDELGNIEVVDELKIVEEARKEALKHQQETFEFLSDIVLPQLDFKAPIIAADLLRESVEQMRQFNAGLSAFRNIFSEYEKSIQNIVEISREVTKSFQFAATLSKQISEMLSVPLLLPLPRTNVVQHLPPRHDIEIELRKEMAELKDELVKYRQLIELPTQPLLPAQTPEPVRYDKTTKTIFIKGVPVEIDTNTRSGNQVDLCNLLFKNKTTIKNGISNTEIFVLWGNYDVDVKYVRNNWRAIYHTVKRINEKVANKTFAPQFIECSTYRTKINKFYL